MAEKNFNNVRIINKHDTEANWLKATGFTPKQGELIVYDIDENYEYERIKIGDGVQNINSLPFVDADVQAKLLTKAPKTNPSILGIIKTSNDFDNGYTEIFKNNSATADYGTMIKDYTADGDKVSLTVSADQDKIYASGGKYGVNSEVLTTVSVDTTLSSESTNPVQNKIVNAAISNLNTLVGDTSVSEQINTALLNSQPDMLQNDSTQADYVKNRTHWKEELGVQVLFDGTIETDYGWNANQGVPVAIEIKVGATYSVVYDSTTYEVVGKAGADNLPYIGSDSLWNNDSYVETEEPFCYGEGWFAASVDGTHTVVISGEAAEWHTIEKEYLPGILIRPGDGYKSEVFNDITNTASGIMSHAEGSYTSATGAYSHAEGCANTASGTYSHAEGYDNEASGWHAHAEGFSTVASGNHSHAEGRDTEASGFTSHAEGRNTIAAGEYQHVQGKYNVVDESSIYAHIVGNGGVRGMEFRSNAHTIDWFGNAWFRGDLRVGGTSYNDAVSLVPKHTTVTLSSANWTGSSNPWSQVVTVNGVTANSKVDLQPTATQIVDLQNQDIMLMTENNDGVITAYAIGGKPTKNYTMQALITEVIPV